MIYEVLFRRVLVRIHPERAHALAARALRALAAIPWARRALGRFLAPHDRCLEVRALGLTFPSPLGVAAGVDKDASWFDSLGLLGFGFCEIGTVTSLAQPGNDGSRVIRIPDERALVNRMGFPNPGAAVIAQRLSQRTGATLVGVNIGKTKSIPASEATADYGASVRQLASLADYVVLNVSSPNTPGLRDMQTFDHLAALIKRARVEMAAAGCPTPLLIKVGPDLEDDQIDLIGDLALDLELDGIVSVNTTLDPSGLKGSAAVHAAAGAGGISGPPVRDHAIHFLRRLYQRVGDRVVLISVGGIDKPSDAWERILAGATLVQAYTGFVYGGPFWPSRINRGLSRLVRDAGASSIQDMVGAEAGSAGGARRSGGTSLGQRKADAVSLAPWASTN